MRLLRPLLLLSAALGLIAGSTVSAVADPSRIQPLAPAHAHNDYEHARPLFDALDHGFTSVEADIFLVDGQLLVAHDPEDLRPDRTLQSLYLEPLRQLVIANHGKVYPGRRMPFQILIDIKNTGAATYAELDRVLRSPRYAFLFTQVEGAKVRRGAITAVVSGDRPRDVMAAQHDRFAFYDGRIADPNDLGPGADPALTPLVSDNWTKLFGWTGIGPMPEAERATLHRIVATAHDAGQRVRFWATPDLPGPERTAIWQELLAAGVDHINTDDLPGLERFLRDR
jgi:glycerophosphoryl diester phosphodiesterase